MNITRDVFSPSPPVVLRWRPTSQLHRSHLYSKLTGLCRDRNLPIVLNSSIACRRCSVTKTAVKSLKLVGIQLGRMVYPRWTNSISWKRYICILISGPSLLRTAYKHPSSRWDAVSSLRAWVPHTFGRCFLPRFSWRCASSNIGRSDTGRNPSLGHRLNLFSAISVC